MQDAVQLLETLSTFSLTPAGIGGIVMLLVRYLRHDAVQHVLPEKFRWDNLPMWAQVAVPFVLAAVGTALGAPSLAAISAAAIVKAGLLAVGMHVVTKKAGEVAAPKSDVPPGYLRKSIAVVIPIPGTPIKR